MSVGHDDGPIFKKRPLLIRRQDYGLWSWAGTIRDSCLALAAHVTVIALVVNFATAINAVLCHKPRSYLNSESGLKCLAASLAHSGQSCHWGAWQNAVIAKPRTTYPGARALRSMRPSGPNRPKDGVCREPRGAATLNEMKRTKLPWVVAVILELLPKPPAQLFV